MKRFLAASLLLLYLFSTTELHQFLKMPLLIEHFAEHQQKDTSITFWHFLNLHYFNGDPNDADHDRDMKLPFKTHDNCSFTNLITILPDQKFNFETKPLKIQYKKLNCHYTFSFSSKNVTAIWQPPQFS
jgi:hypothetical protein